MQQQRWLSSCALIVLLCCGAAVRLAEAQPQQPQPRLSVQKGHEEGIHRMAVSADGRTLASSSLDYSVRLWDVEKGWELGVLDAENVMLSHLAFSGDGRRLVGYRDSVIIWDVATGRKLHSYAPPLSALDQYLVSMDGRRLLVVRETNAVELLEAETGRVLKTFVRGGNRRLDEVTIHIAASPDWKTFFVYGGEGGLVRSLDVASGATRFSFKASPSRLTVSRDGTLMAFVDDAAHALVVADAATGKELWRKPNANSPWLAFDASAKQLTAFHETEVVAFDAHTGQEAGKWPGVKSNPTDNKYEKDLSFITLPDGSGYAFNPNAPRDIEIDIRTRDNQLLRTLAGRASTIDDVAFSPDGKSLVLAPNDHHSGDSSVDDAVFLLNYADGTQGRALIQPKGGVMHLAYSPDGKRLATAGLLSLTLWDLERGGVMRELEASVSFGNLVFSPDGKLLASYSYNSFKLWDVASGGLARQLSDNKETINFIAFSPDGKLLAAVNDKKKEVVLWDTATGQPARVIPNVFGTIAFSPDGKAFAASGPEGGIVFVDPATGTVVSRANAAPPKDGKPSLVGYHRFTYSPDGKTLAAVAVVLNPQGNSRLRINNAWVRADSFIRLWDTATGAELRTLSGHAEFIMSLAFSGDGKYLLSGSRDRLAKLWEVASGKELASLTPVDRDDWIVMTPDGLFDGSPAAWSAILWRFSDNLRDAAPVEAFFNEYYYPNLLTELMSGKRPSAPGGGLAGRDRRLPRLDLTLSGETSPPNALTAREAKVKINVADAPAGAKDVRLFRNGSLVRVWRGDVLKGEPNVTLEATLPIVAGENHLTAYAFNRDNVKSPDARLDLHGADSLKRKGVIYMLAIGVNEYANANFNLKYAVADARSFASAFVKQQSRLGLYAGVKPVGILDRNATKANIMRALAALAKLVQPEDAVVVYFAGHGMAYQNQFYLLPHDLGYAGGRSQLDAAGLQLMLSRSVSDRELESAFEGVDAGSFLLVIDACNSGQALESEEGRRGPMNAKGLAQLAYEKGMYVLTAAQSFQAAQEVSKLGHGLLTYVLVEEGLSQKAADAEPKDGRILLREWLDYTTRRVPEMQVQEIARSIERGGDLSFADDDGRGLNIQTKPQQRVSQRPRVFYRRETELIPLVVSRP